MPPKNQQYTKISLRITTKNPEFTGKPGERLIGANYQINRQGKLSDNQIIQSFAIVLIDYWNDRGESIEDLANLLYSASSQIQKIAISLSQTKKLKITMED